MTTKALTATALTALATASLLLNARADITTGLAGYWTLDEGSGSSVADTSGSSPANNGTLTQFADTGFTTMWTSGWIDNAVIFNQNGENTNNISVPNSTSLNAPSVNKQWTLAAWVKPSVIGSSQPNDTGIICKGTWDKEAYVMSLYQGKIRAKMRNSAGANGFTITGTTVLQPNTWYHVAVTAMIPKGTNNSALIVYVNGVRESGSDANTFTTVYTSSQPVTIGTRANSSGTLLSFQGTIDDVRVYSRLLSPSDIFQLYTNNAPGSAHLPVISRQPRDVNCYSNDTPAFSVAVATTNSYVPLFYQWQFNGADIPGATNNPLRVLNVTSANAGSYSVIVSNYAGCVTSSPAMLAVRPLPASDTTSGLAGWWKFDDASGSANAADSSGGNAGALTGFSDTFFTTMWEDGIIGGALRFNDDGTTANVVAIPGVGLTGPAALDFSTSPVFTLAAWVNASLTQSNQAGIIAKGTGAGGEQYCLDINGANYRFFVRDASGTTFSVPTTGPFNGFWQHVAAVVNATNGLMNFYLNGALVGSGVAPTSLLATNHEVSIGNRQSGTAAYNMPFTGALDDVRIYNRDLTSADVYALYAANAYPIITAQLPANGTNPFTLFAGSSPTFKVTASGAVPFSYQWYTNGVPDAAGTNASYQFSNLPVGEITSYCIITNNVGSATSYVWTASVVAAPTAAYPQVVLQDTPVGYWRLNEAPVDNNSGNNGVVANDYLNGNFGLYANTVLGLDGYSRALSNQFGYYPATEPDVTAAQFGYFGGPSNYVAGIQGVDLSKPVNQTGNFSIEAWVKGDSFQSYNAGIVAKGAWGAEQFTLDTGGTSYSYRFTMRDASKKAYYITSNTNYPDGNWHHLVGVLDEANSNACFYVDGVKVASLATSPTNGVLSTTVPMTIGCRLGSGSVGYNQQFFGTINDVAIYTNALTSSQVMNHYLAAGIPPVITQNPAVWFTNVNEGTTLTIAAQGGGGTPPVTTQWYDTTTSTPVPGQTNTTLVISNISAALYNGHTLALTVSNAYGHPSSSGMTVYVQSGAPLVTVNPSSVTVYPNMPVVFSVTATGTEPFTYQWSKNGSAVPGATSSTYAATVDSGSALITCTVNGPGGSTPGSATLTAQAVPSDSYGSRIVPDQPVAYWRLDELPGAAVANDYAGGHNATYSSAVNGLPGFGASNPDTATGFGMNGVTSGSMALEQANSGVQLIDFSTMGTNASFSVEAWVKVPAEQSSGGIVTKGYGHAEQFSLDVYGNVFRFYGRDPSNNPHGPTSSFHPDGLWHHLVGVYNGTNGLINLFIDGTVQASATNTPGLGILPTTVPTSIGARTSSSSDSAYSLQLSNAVVDDVAIYAYALTTNQIVSHFTTAAIPPQFVQDLPAQVYAYVGFPLSLSVSASSTTPMTYQWQRNGVNLTDSGGISGANSNTLTLSVGDFSTGNTFQAFVTNQATPIAAASTRATLTILPRLGFNGFGTGWSSQGNLASIPRYIDTNVLRLTDGGGSEACSSFFGYPVYVGGFLATFTYQAGGNRAGDGTAFVVQSDSRGAAALGSGGGGLGYTGTNNASASGGGITNSAAVEFNLYSNRGVGYAFQTNGVAGVYTSASPVNLASGDPIDVTVYYANGVLSLTMTDAVAMTSFTASTNLDLPAVVGTNVAYVGFTSGDGGATSIQTISNFTFVSLPTLAIQPTAGNQVIVAWPQQTGGYVLQQSTSLDSAWTSVSTPPISVGGVYQVTLPAGANNTFYRLINSQ